MEYSLHVFEKLHEKQQKGEGTDCSFIFNQQDDNETESTPKVIHAHKMILSLASSYFETAFKEEWNGNKPILITTFEPSLFEKLINSIYLNKIDFTDLDEGLDLYEAAHFYGIQMILDALQHKIQEICYETNVTKIKRLYELAEKFENYQAYYKCNEFSSLEVIRPAINAIRFQSFTPEIIESITLLTDEEKVYLIEGNVNRLPAFSKIKNPRYSQRFFYMLPENLQEALIQRTTHNVCFVCKSYHITLTCKKATEKFSCYEKLLEEGENKILGKYTATTKLSNYLLTDIMQLLKIFQQESVNPAFKIFADFECYTDPLLRTFFIENFEAEDFEGRSIVTFNYTKKDGTYLINGLIHVLKPIQNYMVQVESTSIPSIGPRITFINRTKYSNVSLSCPVKAMTYSINKFQLDMDQLPSFIPVIDQQIYFYARSFNLNNDGSEENYLIVKNVLFKKRLEVYSFEKTLLLLTLPKRQKKSTCNMKMHSLISFNSTLIFFLVFMIYHFCYKDNMTFVRYQN
uniref:CSON010473 protein n=1 Tax=Culicoides sonorensis TaxID=179676 RepID=A0A336N3I0_CULSO